MVRGAFGVDAPARPALLLSLVTFLPASAFAVDRLFEFAEAIQIRFAPKPHGPAVTNAQLRRLKLFCHYPAVQGHDRNARYFGGLLRVTGFYIHVIYIPYLLYLVQLLFVSPCKVPIMVGAIRGGETFDLMQLLNLADTAARFRRYMLTLLLRHFRGLRQSGVEIPYAAIKSNIADSVHIVVQANAL